MTNTSKQASAAQQEHDERMRQEGWLMIVGQILLFGMYWIGPSLNPSAWELRVLHWLIWMGTGAEALYWLAAAGLLWLKWRWQQAEAEEQGHDD